MVLVRSVFGPLCKIKVRCAVFDPPDVVFLVGTPPNPELAPKVNRVVTIIDVDKKLIQLLRRAVEDDSGPGLDLPEFSITQGSGFSF
jgi:hypothetical protein